MSEGFKTTTGKRPGAWKILLYGCPGSGKSTLATFAPKPFFLDLEAGLDRIDCWKSEDRLTTYEQVMDGLRFATGSQDCQTVVIDTLDELDAILSKRVCDREKKQTLGEIPYGKGGDLLVNEWQNVITIFEKIKERGKNVLLIGHEQVVRFEDPSAESYDRFQLRIHKKAAPVVMAKMDAVLFARYETFTKEKESGRGYRALGGERIIHCLEAPSYWAKNRFGLPATIPMTSELFSKIV